MAQPISQSALNVQADPPDFRDRYYEPSLSPLKECMHPPGNLHILDQGDEGACTGFGLAATINLLYRFQRKELRVSPRMLYTFARRYDEWAGEDYEGSSCRGAIKGWKNTGVCLEELEDDAFRGESFVITPKVAADARCRTVGAYYRIRPDITDFHSALNEVGVIYASAKVHKGWFKTKTDKDGDEYIPLRTTRVGGHAFAIVGYNHKGFWVQNSWGEGGWGKGGLALWLYEDWAKNAMDAWAVQLALPTPQIFSSGVVVGNDSPANRRAGIGSVPRQVIQHHFVHLDDGKYHDKERYWSNAQQMELITHQLQTRDYDHLLLYAHGGLNSTKDCARRIAAMKDIFLENGIYPFHFMYDTGLGEELKDVVAGKRSEAEMLAGGVRDWFDRRIENLSRRVGRALWREMKYGARAPFTKNTADGADVLKRLISTITGLDRKIGIHVAGHSTGAILHAHALARAAALFDELIINSCSLLAPAATNKLFETHYVPLLKSKVIKDLVIYNLTDQLEQDDHVAKVYGKSLLYLVARAFEESPVAPLLGMQKFNKELDIAGLPVTFAYSQGKKGSRTAAMSHGGFDNDPDTMNDMLKRILGKAPARPFKPADLVY
ncbi:C1 family peptidase [Proteobacteria bacterium 005FR1]|nr:C1 family peptidase [Proteobacteria bacterium 005FR1]